MPRILPFQGVRYNPARVPDITRVTAPPYDMISARRAGGALPARPAQRGAADPRPRAGERPSGRPLRERGRVLPALAIRGDSGAGRGAVDLPLPRRLRVGRARLPAARADRAHRDRRVRRRRLRPRVDHERPQGRPAAAAAGLRGELQPDFRPLLRPRRVRRGAAGRRDSRAAAGLVRRRQGRRAQSLAGGGPGADRPGARGVRGQAFHHRGRPPPLRDGAGVSAADASGAGALSRVDGLGDDVPGAHGVAGAHDPALSPDAGRPGPGADRSSASGPPSTSRSGRSPPTARPGPARRRSCSAAGARFSASTAAARRSRCCARKPASISRATCGRGPRSWSPIST